MTIIASKISKMAGGGNSDIRTKKWTLERESLVLSLNSLMSGYIFFPINYRDDAFPGLGLDRCSWTAHAQYTAQLSRDQQVWAPGLHAVFHATH
jgi:hypothetical protein